jgi:Predicted transcriptional regulators
MAEKEQLQSFITELRRGSLILVVLACCLKESYYGYSLLQAIQARGIEIEANTLYPLLRRLESQELLVSKWDTGESRPRKYYSISEKGKTVYIDLRKEWEKLHNSIEEICKGDV